MVENDVPRMEASGVGMEPNQQAFLTHGGCPCRHCPVDFQACSELMALYTFHCCTETRRLVLFHHSALGVEGAHTCYLSSLAFSFKGEKPRFAVIQEVLTPSLLP